MSKKQPNLASVEVVVFSVKDPEGFKAVQAATHTHLATFEGYVQSVRLRSAANPSVFADIVAWETFEAAGHAAEKVRTDGRFAPLMSNIDKISLYGHYALAPEPRAFLADLARAPVVEIAAYGVRDADAHVAVHTKVHEALRSREGFRAGAPGHQREDSSQFLDVIAWENPEAHKRAGAAIQGVPELAPFFAGITEMKVFELFTPAP